MAIASDATSTGVNSSTSLTVSHTCTGSDRVLEVSCWTNAGDTTGVTYNGVSMTAVYLNQDVGGVRCSTFTLVNPASGTNNIVLSRSGTNFNVLAAKSYTGVDQTTPNYGSASQLNSATNPTTVAATAASADDWFYLASMGNRETTANTNLTLQANGVQADIFDSNGTVGSTSSRNYSVDLTAVTANANYIQSFFLKEATSSSSFIKSADGVVIASIKSADGVVIASIKSADGVANS